MTDLSHIKEEYPGVIYAMPIGSDWEVYSHQHDISLGKFSVTSHLRQGMEFYSHAAQKVLILKYPANNNWTLQGDHVRIGDGKGGLSMTYAPA